jgi:hypothetical protein
VTSRQHCSSSGHNGTRWILEVAVPDIKQLACLPALHIRPSIEPCRDPLHSGSEIVRATAKLHYHVQLVFLSSTTAVAPVRLDGFLDESVKEFVEPLLSVSGDDQLPSPFGEFAIMFFLAESLLHLSILLNGTIYAICAGNHRCPTPDAAVPRQVDVVVSLRSRLLPL